MKALLMIGLSATAAGCSDDVARVPGGDAARGRIALERYECGACHEIPGIRNAHGRVGPTLAGYARSVYVAGQWPLEPAVLARFIFDPPAMAPGTAMPAVGINHDEARDIVAYLYTLD